MDVLGVFARHPVPGLVKTRLAAQLGAAFACDLQTAFLEDIIDRVRAFADRRLLCDTPSDEPARDYFGRLVSRSFDLWPQPEESLGTRMEQFFVDQFAQGASRVIIIGCDSPTLPREYLSQALQLLDSSDCVIGPASDGGYYLVGQRQQAWPIFNDIDWGGPEVFQQTLDRIAACGARLALLPEFYDIDTFADLEHLRDDLVSDAAEGRACVAPRTLAVLLKTFDAIR